MKFLVKIGKGKIFTKISSALKFINFSLNALKKSFCLGLPYLCSFRLPKIHPIAFSSNIISLFDSLVGEDFFF